MGKLLGEPGSMERLLLGQDVSSFSLCDEDEVAGYAEADEVFLVLTEGPFRVTFHSEPGFSLSAISRGCGCPD